MTPEDRAIGLLIKLHRDHDIYVAGAAKEPIQTEIRAAENDALERAAIGCESEAEIIHGTGDSNAGDQQYYEVARGMRLAASRMRALKHPET